MTEQHTIHLPVIRYRDKSGQPTCAVVPVIGGDTCSEIAAKLAALLTQQTQTTKGTP